MDEFARLFKFNWGKQPPLTNDVKVEISEELSSKPMEALTKPATGNSSSKGRSAAALARRKERNKIIARNARVRKKAEFSQLSEEYEQALFMNKKLRQLVLKELPSEVSEKVLRELNVDIHDDFSPTAVNLECDADSSCDEDIDNQQELVIEDTIKSDSLKSRKVPKKNFNKDAVVRTRKSDKTLEVGKAVGENSSYSIVHPSQPILKSSFYKSIPSHTSFGTYTPAADYHSLSEVIETNSTTTDNPASLASSPATSPRIAVINDTRNNLAPISPWPIISGGITDILQVAEDMDRLYPQMDLKFPTPRTVVVGTGDQATSVNHAVTGIPKRPQHRQQPAAHSASFFNSYNIPSFFMGV